jgi:hypothetical protein
MGYDSMHSDRAKKQIYHTMIIAHVLSVNTTFDDAKFILF